MHLRNNGKNSKRFVLARVEVIAGMPEELGVSELVSFRSIHFALIL
jgi:hypothetical protein